MSEESDYPTVNVRVPQELRNLIDSELERRGFRNRSEFIRSAIRDALEFNRDLPEEVREDIALSRRQIEEEKSVPFENVLEDEGINIEGTPQDFGLEIDPLAVDAIGIWDDRGEFVEDGEPQTNVKVVGCGSAGSRLIGWLDKIDHNSLFETIAIDTDKDDLSRITADTKILLRPETTNDQYRIDSVKETAEALSSQLQEILEPADIVFLLTGLGGDAGTGIAPTVAATARSPDTTVVCVATLPHRFEPTRRKRAISYIDEIEENVDTFAILDPVEFEDYTHSEGIGRVYEEINRYIVGIIQQLVTRIDQFKMIDWNENMAAFLDNGGFATLVSGSVTPDQSDSSVIDTLFSRSLIDVESEQADRAILLIQGGPDIEEDDVHNIVYNIATHADHVAYTFTRNSKLENRIRVTGILTGFTFDPSKLTTGPERAYSVEDEEEPFRFMSSGSTSQSQEGLTEPSPA